MKMIVGTKFHFKQTILNLRPNLPKKVFSVENGNKLT